MNNYTPHNIPTHAYLIEDALNFGVESAALLYHIKYILQRNEHSEQNIFEDLYWYRIEKEELLRQFPYFKNRQKIERLLSNLVKNGVLICKNHNENQSDQTKWYALHTAETLNAQNRALQCSDVGIGNDENNGEKGLDSSTKPAQTLNAQNRAMQCPDVSIPMPTSGHSHIYNIDSKETLETPRKRVLDNGFGLLEFVERYNQIAQANAHVVRADEVLFSAEGDRCDKIHFIIGKYSRSQIDAVFKTTENNNFLLGQTNFKDGKPFRLSLAWLIKPESFKKIIDGKYAKAQKPGTAAESRFKPEPKPYEGVSNWAERASELKNKPLRLTKTMLPRVEKYIATSSHSDFAREKGLGDKLFVVVWDFLFPGKAHLSTDEINRGVHTHRIFPELYQAPAPKAKTGGDA